MHRNNRSGQDNKVPWGQGAPTPLTANSRAAGLASDTVSDRGSGSGPTSSSNSRFSSRNDEIQRLDHERSVAPLPTNDRFGRLMESESRENDQGPPPAVASRFSEAARAFKEDESNRQQRGGERQGWDGDRGSNRGGDYPRGGGDRVSAGSWNTGPPPSVQNSRFAMAAAMDQDYAERGEQHRGMGDRNQMRSDRFQSRGGDRGGYGGDRGGYGGDRGGYGGDRGGYGGERGGRDRNNRDYDDRNANRNSFANDLSDLPRGPKSSVVEVAMPKIQVKVEAPLAPVNIATLDATHAANVLVVPTKALEDKLTISHVKKKDEESYVAPKKTEKKLEAIKKKAVADSLPVNEELLNEFASGNRLGDELKVWCVENKAALPSVEKLVLEMLNKHEKLRPDPDCGWAESAKFGLALLALIDDDVNKQIEVLWAIQLFCDSIGFPKLNESYVVQSMFRAMYKYDLASADAFFEWKEDESEQHEVGKLKTVIQTVDWFNWLEQDDEEDDEEEEG
jgi:hypothetical protein